MKVFVIVPAYNEGKKIGTVLKELRELPYEIVVVDDASSDDTAMVASQFNVVLLRHLINRGQGAALMTGLEYATKEGADAVVTFDADGQHQVADIERLLQPIIRGTVDVVLGSRFLEGENLSMPAVRKMMLKAAVIFTRLASRVDVTDTHNGLRAFSRKALETIKIHQDRMSHASEILDEIHRYQLKFCEVPVKVQYTDYSLGKGQSSSAFAKVLFKYMVGRIMR